MSAGIRAALLASLTFSLMNVCAKKLAAGMPVAEVVFMRGLLGTLLTLGLMRWRAVRFESKRPWLLASRGVFGGVSLLSGFYALAHLKLAEASILAHLSPLFVVLLGWLVLKEKLDRAFWGAFGLAFLGVLWVVQPGFAVLEAGPAAFALLGAAIGAGASISIRSLSKDHSTEVIMLAFMVTAMLVSLPFFESFLWPQPQQLPWLLGLGTVSFVAQWFLTRAYALESAGRVATARYSGVVFNLGWGVLLWGEFLNLGQLLGVILVLFGCHRLRPDNR